MYILLQNNLNSGRQSENAGEIKQRRKKRLYRLQLFLRKNEAFSDQRISKHPSHIITTSHQSQPCMPTSQPLPSTWEENSETPKSLTGNRL